MSYPNSKFVITRDTLGAIMIVDLNMGTMSVTNDAENVVKYILEKCGNHRIFYKDSSGDWDELVHNGTHFTRFCSISPADKVKFQIP